jgi:enoyl-CoA hydratase
MTAHATGDVSAAAAGAEPPHALIERRGQVLIVTMNRPEARNALSAPMMALLRQAWDMTDSDPGIRVCVLAGAGGAFCAGADLKAMTSEHPGSRMGELDLSVIEPLLKGRRLTKPLIAAVEGPAIAGGTEILQACDIRVAGESARFGISEARWGLFPLGGSAVRLPRQIPYTVAADLLLTGRHITAAEALSIGLIGHVVPDGQALGKALEIAEAIASGPSYGSSGRPRACRRTRRSPSKPRRARPCSPARTPGRGRAPSPRSGPPIFATAENGCFARSCVVDPAIGGFSTHDPEMCPGGLRVAWPPRGLLVAVMQRRLLLPGRRFSWPRA